MVYLHEAPYSDGLVRHWANENESASDTTATYMIRQVETDIEYGEAIDVIPCRYTYETTDVPIEPEENATESDYLAALGEFGVNV